VLESEEAKVIYLVDLPDIGMLLLAKSRF